jgi:hypothetical protein
MFRVVYPTAASGHGREDDPELEILRQRLLALEKKFIRDGRANRPPARRARCRLGGPTGFGATLRRARRLGDAHRGARRLVGVGGAKATMSSVKPRPPLSCRSLAT